jgi:hypothetical protein
MIHQVSIKSLPQEWLWCETWCDDASKKSAKTIDLVSINKILILTWFTKIVNLTFINIKIKTIFLIH